MRGKRRNEQETIANIVSNTIKDGTGEELQPLIDADGHLQIDTLSSPLPTNAATETTLADCKTALQIIDNFISGTKGLVTEDNSNAIKTALEIIDNMISGSEAQVDVVAALPAGTNLIGQVYGYDNTNTIYSGTTSRTPKFAIIDAATSGDNTLVAAETNKIRVLSAFLVAAGTVNARFESGAGGTALTGQMNLVANTGFVLPYNPLGWFETASATLLNLELSAAVSVDGCLVYIDTA